MNGKSILAVAAHSTYTVLADAIKGAPGGRIKDMGDVALLGGDFIIDEGRFQSSYLSRVQSLIYNSHCSWYRRQVHLLPPHEDDGGPHRRRQALCSSQREQRGGLTGRITRAVSLTSTQCSPIIILYHSHLIIQFLFHLPTPLDTSSHVEERGQHHAGRGSNLSKVVALPVGYVAGVVVPIVGDGPVPLKHPCGGKVLLPKRLVVAAAGRCVAHRELRHVDLGDGHDIVGRLLGGQLVGKGKLQRLAGLAIADHVRLERQLDLCPLLMKMLGIVLHPNAFQLLP